MEGKKIFNHISQVGFIVKDADMTIKAMQKIFGVLPDAQGHVAPTNKKYRGNSAEFDSMILLYNFANVQLEFIQPISGKNIWQEHLDKHGEGLHHVRFTVDNYDEAEMYLSERGIVPLQQGDSLTPNLRWDYFDTESVLGFVLETMSVRTK